VNGYAIRNALGGIGVLLLVGATGSLAAHCLTGCDSAATQAQRAKNALDVKAYDDALSECRKEGREMQSWSVYERCAKEADIRYGVDGGAP
jgi:hypothetical protein